MNDLKGKTVIVTGSAKGIGKEIALVFAANGANIVLNDIGDVPETVIGEIEEKGVKCLAVKCDISDFTQSGELIKKAKEAFGSVDVLVNNAGITRDGLIMRMSEEDFDTVISINLKGTFNTIRHVSSIMLKQRSGAIINMASVVGVTGNLGQANYAAGKAGVIGLTKAVARELSSRGITCNAIAPGFIETDMTKVLPDNIKAQMLASIPLKRFAQPKEVAEVALFLALNNYITGQVIHIDGGMVM